MASVDIAIIGVGLVGSELVSQLVSFAPSPTPSLPSVTSRPFNIVSLSSSKLTLPLSSPLLPSFDWKSELKISGKPIDLNALVESLSERTSKGKTVVIVDNTSNDDVASLYPTWLEKGINIVTPNKKAFSGSLDLYEHILKSAEVGKSRVYNEATVGAGLPIVATLRELVATGDKITKIEGVFSGTLSYIFNEFSSPDSSKPKRSFSSVVSVAKDNGYTEPHPGDDLSGSDVARKLTILSRLVPSLASHLPEGFTSVATSSLVADTLQDINSPDEFMSALPQHDGTFEKMRSEAEAEGEVIRYVGVIDVENNKVEAKLARYPRSHPFASALGGSDNIVAFHTARYSKRPLIIQGAGAGAEVTAMGVLGDLIRFL